MLHVFLKKKVLFSHFKKEVALKYSFTWSISELMFNLSCFHVEGLRENKVSTKLMSFFLLLFQCCINFFLYVDKYLSIQSAT